MSYFVDAHNGRVLDRWINRDTAAATGTGNTIYPGTSPLTTNSIAARLRTARPDARQRPTPSTAPTAAPPAWSSPTPTTSGATAPCDRATAAADAQYGVAMTWDYFKNVHGRNGIDNDGVGAYSRVHYGINYVNAFWNDSCFCMTYGDGDGVTFGPLVALDIAGHEMSHGVTCAHRRPGLLRRVRRPERSHLGHLRHDGRVLRQQSADTPDYLIGEKIYVANVPGSANSARCATCTTRSPTARSPNC